MKSAHHRGAPLGSSPTLLRDFTPGGLRVSPELTIAKTPTVAGRQLCVMGKRAACAFGLNAVSIARHIVRKQMPSWRPAGSGNGGLEEGSVLVTLTNRPTSKVTARRVLASRSRHVRRTGMVQSGTCWHYRGAPN